MAEWAGAQEAIDRKSKRRVVHRHGYRPKGLGRGDKAESLAASTRRSRRKRPLVWSSSSNQQQARGEARRGVASDRIVRPSVRASQATLKLQRGIWALQEAEDAGENWAAG